MPGAPNSELPTFESNVKFFQTKLDEANKTLEEAKANYAKNPTKLNQQLVDNANGLVGTFTGQLTAAQAKLNGAQKAQKQQQEQVDYWTNQVKGVKDSARYAEFVNEINTDKAIVQKFNDAKTNMKNAAASAEKVAPLKAAYDEALQTLKAYQNQLAAAQAKLAAMKGETTPTNPDQPSDKPGQNTGDNTNNNTSDTTNKDNVAPNFTGEKNGNYYVNGKQVTKAAYDAHVAAQSLATVKTSASVKGASVAATANDSKALPQTGNENASAVVALGAVSAMFGLGLAAKKREF
ncbi:LPXTG cell wall anchor domain-containing protein [Limosilactobacillus portuensis]|uniref:LPXTG cell wall anchor domain-containing protein n=1 Tax=Limosilactobacillus portuensis TaxID=2742601 RepID=UPI003D7419F1